MPETTDRKLEEITEIRLLDYFWILFRNKWSVLLIFFLCVLAAFLITDATPKVYQSETTLRILDGQPPTSLISGLPLSGILKGTSLGTYVTLLQSRDLIIAPTVQQLIDEGLLEPRPIHRGKTIQWLTKLLNIELDSSVTEQGELSDTEWRDFFIKTLIDEKLKVEESQDGNMITLTVKQQKPEDTQLLCNRIATTLVETIEAEKEEDMKWWEKPLPQTMLNEATQKLKTSEKELFDFQKDNSELTLNAEGGTQAQLVLALQLSENELASQLIGAELKHDSYKEDLKDVEEELISETVARNPSYSKLEDNLNEYEIEKKALIGRYGKTHPEITSLDEKRKETEARLKDTEKEIKSTTSSYNPLHQVLTQKVNETEAAIISLKKQKEKVSAEIDKRIKEVGGWSEKHLNLFRYKRNVEIYSAQVIALEAKMRESQIVAEARTDSIKVLDQARLPEEPIKPRMKVNLVLGAMLGGLLGLTFAVVKNYFQDTYLRLEDSVRQLDSLAEPPNFLGVIPSIKKRSAYRIPLIVNDAPNSRAAEAFRVLVAKLPFLNLGNELKTVLVTSSTRGEGKSTISSNLAAAFAQKGSKVLLIDADMRRPSQHTFFPPEQLLQITAQNEIDTVDNDTSETHEVTHSDSRKPGLSEALITINSENGYDVLQSTVRQTGIPNLHLVPGGTVPPNPIELLNSDMMTQWLEVAKSEYDVIVIDSAPVRAVADPVILATVVDAVVYAFDITKTKRFDVLTGIKHLTDVLPDKCIGVVCNMINPKHAKSYGYYNRHGGYYKLTDKEG
jgi:capsular exopolysaccharide synthesis family protein